MRLLTSRSGVRASLGALSPLPAGPASNAHAQGSAHVARIFFTTSQFAESLCGHSNVGSTPGAVTSQPSCAQPNSKNAPKLGVAFIGLPVVTTPTAAIAQLGERQTEDLKVPGSIPGLGICCDLAWGHVDNQCSTHACISQFPFWLPLGIEPTTFRVQD